MYDGVVYYVTESGDEPFWKWFKALNKSDRYSVHDYIRRVAYGGSSKNITRIKGGSGVCEIIIDRGPGFRIYFAVDRRVMVILLGGTKGDQKSDIKRAKLYWRSYGKKK